MKKTLIFLSILGSTLVSCKDDFLDLSPVSQTNVNNFYKTASDMNAAVNATYSALQLAGQYTDWYVFSEIPSDNTTNPLSGSVTDMDEFDKFYIRSTNPFLDARWNDTYRGIARANTVLDRIVAVSMDENLKSRYIGEAKFLRALMYFNLVRIFGDVPLVLNEVTSVSEGYRHSRTPAAQVYEQIIKDLTEASAALPASYTGNDIGRATQGAAKALLGKVYLTRKASGDYQAAAKVLKEVIDLNLYELLPSYADLFKPSNANNKESIFEVQYKKGGFGEGSNYPNNFAPEFSAPFVVSVGGTGGNNIITQDMEDAYQLNNPNIALRDSVRFKASMAHGYLNGNGQFIERKHIKKFSDTPFQNNDSDDNWYVLRLADVFLMYSEALNELNNGPTTDAYTYLNLVRERANVAPVANLSYEAFKLALENERRVELAFEGHRWFDLVRTGRAIPVMASKGIVVEEYQLLFPIPQRQIDVNPGQITQNPGHTR
ncbi:RagB/SusD family nutrient uptake outer membrane protein [Rhodocytophaga aerolata]|uniref:RagB/SusD family nutrient uptake outer membrane protein n=1 Tax=Rhodocytophaga aerolata TaxID=455078 RepID=A0ABT8RFW8_9BACT|nr:RagB/SusD family nutrient uptake outer membrane protein [Rhodocytophaga aerolata]MDO1450234.1 RagB/SusD family nutrient uptake outer membrane protein [Rhodocytophaga aerolata]